MKSPGPDDVVAELTTFDADRHARELQEQLSALEPPAFRQHGRLRLGRLLSFEQWRVYEADLLRLQSGSLTEHQVQSLIYRYVSAVFPEPRWKRATAVAAVLVAVLGPLVGLSRFTATPLWMRLLLALALTLLVVVVLARHPSVAWSVLRLPYPAQVRAMQRFLDCQKRANAVWLTLLSPTSTRQKDDAKPQGSPNPT